MVDDLGATPAAVPDAALGLAGRCDAAELYDSLRLADPFLAAREAFTGTVITGTVTDLPARGALVVRADRLSPDGRLTLTVTDATLRPGTVVAGQPVTLRPRAADRHRQQNARRNLRTRYRTLGNWLAGGPPPAPDALSAAYPDLVTRLRLPRSWRLGPDTTAVIQPAFYPTLPFTSARPPRHLSLAGHPLPEISTTALDVPGGPGDPRIPAAPPRRSTPSSPPGSSSPRGDPPAAPRRHRRRAPHVGQARMIAAHLVGTGGVLVATTNQAQGLERDAVVVVHPLTGYRLGHGLTCAP